MAFRGVLLQLIEAKSKAGFCIVAPDAELMLPHQPVLPYETSLTKCSQQKLVVTDAVSHKLLQVMRLATMTLQQGEKSVLWGVTESFAPSEAHTVDDAPLKSYADVSKAIKPMHVLSSRKPVAVASPSLIVKANTTNGLMFKGTEDVKSPTRRCYCFHFRSDFEYELFAHTLAAFTRMQQYVLLQSSVVMEMEISHEHKKKRTEEELHAAIRAQQRLELLQTKKEKKQQVVQTQTKPKAKVVIATMPSKMICALCRIQRKHDAPEYPKHPFVLKDGKGEVVHICKLCLQRVLKQRLAMQASAKTGSQDNICGLCAQSMEKMSAKSVKVCAHEVCPRVYCIPCIDKLIGKARVHKVWQTKNWLCPNCSTDDDNAPAGKRESGAGSMSVKIVAATPTPKQKKRKRHKEIEENSKADEGGPPKKPMRARSTTEMKLIDYAVTYFKFLLKREIRDEAEESEDVCFCCKDGGDLIECDWKGMNGAFGRCPKVYHEDCLGYKVPEGKTWACPRHRCQDCGIIAQYSCRFCVTSYCEDHLPKDVKKLGHATKDIPTSTYVMCPRCNQQAQDAFKQEKIGSDLHSQLFRRRIVKR